MTSTTSVELNFKRNEMVILGTEVGLNILLDKSFELIPCDSTLER